MSDMPINKQELLNLLNQKATLVTVNNRLAQFVQKSYQHFQLSHKCTIFESPQIFSYDVWLKKMWQEKARKYYPELVLITSQQSHTLWNEIIQEDNPFFFNVHGVVSDVKKAWKLCCAWNISIEESIFSNNVDTSMFLQWASHYTDILKKNHWIDMDRLPALLKTTLKNEGSSSHSLIISGFDHPSPVVSDLFAQVGPVLVYENQEPADKINKAAFLSGEEEINAFIYWAKEQIESGKKVAGVIPNLYEKRKKLERFLQRNFHEHEYDISAGYIFSESPMIACALKMLSMNKENAILKDFYFLLENVYLNNQNLETLSLQIHEQGNETLSFKNFLKILKDKEINLADKLENFFNVALPEKLKPSEWHILFQEQLAVLGWPGKETLDPVEYQTYHRWLELLKEYQQLDLLFDTISFQKAVFLLEQMAGQIVFQTRKKDAKIHLLGFLEAAELHFDRLWIMGMNDDQFPNTVQLNPFIPYWVQKQYKMPHSSHEVEMEFAVQLMKHFTHGGDEVVFSYLSQKENSSAFESALIRGIEQSLPPLGSLRITPPLESLRMAPPLRTLRMVPPLTKGGRGDFPFPFPSSSLLEAISDDENIPCTPEEVIQGGTTLIKNQALCPFRAFARHRLKALGFELLTKGLNNRDRGNLVHDVLEKFWKKVRTQQQLLSYTEDNLKVLIQKTVYQSVKYFLLKKPEILTPFFEKLEIKRLETLLKNWIEFEKKRPNFAIAALEESKIMNFSGLALHLRADRVDRLSNGDQIVIDYKTGTLPTLSDWDDRPDNPQLLLYALSDPEIKAWAFAQVKAAEPLFKGKSAENIEISGIKTTDWERDRQQWKTALTALADEFIQGKNVVNPKNEAVCNQCDLHGMCRIRDRH